MGLPDAAALFEAPNDADGKNDAVGADGGAPSKAERGRAEGAILGGIRQALAERRAICFALYFVFCSTQRECGARGAPRHINYYSNL